MHDQAIWFTKHVRDSFPDFFKNKRVLDVGGGDINGNNRHLFTDCEYHVNDVMAAPNVTVVSKTKDLLFEPESFDTIVSTECFEHDPEYVESLQKIMALLKPGGLFFFTCASSHRGEHGTLRTTPNQSYGTIAGDDVMSDYYMNLTIDEVNAAIPLNQNFSAWRSYYDWYPRDLCFLGFKRLVIPPYKTETNVETTHCVGRSREVHDYTFFEQVHNPV